MVLDYVKALNLNSVVFFLLLKLFTRKYINFCVCLFVLHIIDCSSLVTKLKEDCEVTGVALRFHWKAYKVTLVEIRN